MSGMTKANPLPFPCLELGDKGTTLSLKLKAGSPKIPQNNLLVRQNRVSCLLE